MAVRYISADDVRRACGAPTSLISDSDIEAAIETIEFLAERNFNTKFTPTQKIESVDGTGRSFLFVKKIPLLAVRALTVNDTDVTPAYLHVYKNSGKITLSTSAETSTFIEKAKTVQIKYLFGLLDESSTSTESSADVTAGTSVSISVDSDTGFADNDWCEIYGMDGNREVFQVSGTPSGNTIVADELVYAHETDSTVVKLQIPESYKRFMEIESAIYVALNAIGATYTFNTHYSIGELDVSKGEPYPQWSTELMKMQQERDLLYQRLSIRPNIRVI